MDDKMIPVRIVPIHPIQRRRWTPKWIAVLTVMLVFLAYLIVFTISMA